MRSASHPYHRLANVVRQALRELRADEQLSDLEPLFVGFFRLGINTLNERSHSLK